MVLSLKAHDPGQPHMPPIEVAMTGSTLSVGRGADNDLALPDPERLLSKRHCLLEARDAGYVLTDLSTNGTFLNYQAERLSEAPVPLNNGDVILVGPFELVVEISAAAAETSSERALAPPPQPVLGPLDEEDSDFLDDLLGGSEAPSADPFAQPQKGASAADHSPPMQDHFAAPRAQAAVIPDDWDAEPVAPTPQPTPAPDTTPALAAFVEGLGIEGLQIPDDQAAEVMGRMGRVMATMITGLREIMMTRAALKSEMRVNRTMIEAGANNPLKFSVSAQQAIEAMTRPAQSGYLAPEAAAAEVLQDIKSHEIATMTGMQAALQALLAQLGPDALSEQGAGGLLSNRKARAWDAYLRHHAKLVSQTEDDFQSAFGREFSRAYEQQISKL